MIARFLAEVESGWRPFALIASNHRHNVLEPIEIEFDQANCMLETLAADPRKDLKIYQDIAEACIGIRRSAKRPGGSLTNDTSVELASFRPRAGRTRSQGRFDANAVKKLRGLVDEYTARDEILAREKVEMLLLALETLLKDEIEPATKTQALDANKLMSVLGATTNVTVNPELNKYFDRFKRIASRSLETTTAAVAVRPSARQYRETVMNDPSSPLTVQFSLKLGPLLELKVTTQRRAPPAVQPVGKASPRQPEALTESR